jgi:hypothetical protein
MIFATPSDLLGADAVLNVEGGLVDADYPLTNLADQRPTEVCRFTTAVALRIVWDFGTATPVEGLFVAMHNIPAGTVVTLCGNTTNSWFTPAVTHTVTVLPWEQGLPVNIAADLRGTAFVTTGYRYVSMHVPAQAANQAFGTALWVAEWQTLDRPCVGEATLADVRRVTVNTTSYGVTHIVDKNVRQRRLRLSFKPTDNDLDAIRALLRDSEGAALAWPIVVHSHTTGAIEAEPVYFVTIDPRSAEELEETWVELNLGARDLDVLELQRGLAL